MSDEGLDALLARIPSERPEGQCLDDGLLLAHREGRLSTERLEEVERHLASCPECRALLAELDPVPAALESWALRSLRTPNSLHTLDSLHRRRRRPAIASIASIASIAALVVAGLSIAVVLAPRDELPSYELRGPLGGVRSTRGGDGESRLFVPDSVFQIVLRPDVRVEEPVSLILFVEAPDGTLVPAPERGASRGEGGGFRYELRARQLFGEDYGPRRAHAVIARGAREANAREGSEEQVRRRLPAHRWMTVEIEYRASVEE